jgi:hypothetical protein
LSLETHSRGGGRNLSMDAHLAGTATSTSTGASSASRVVVATWLRRETKYGGQWRSCYFVLQAGHVLQKFDRPFGALLREYHLAQGERAVGESRWREPFESAVGENRDSAQGEPLLAHEAAQGKAAHTVLHTATA